MIDFNYELEFSLICLYVDCCWLKRLNATQINLIIMKVYSSKEERINVISHAIGFLLSIVALVLLIKKANTYGNSQSVLSVTIYGMSLIVLYAASTLFHSAKHGTLRKRFQIFDHAAIFVLIAGTYTPFALISLPDSTGKPLFIIVWTFALVGIILKLFFTGKYDTISTILYVLMGWMIVFVIKPLINNIALDGLYWLMAGGISYTIGAILYSLKRVKYNHATFHMFVLAGSYCHFHSIYFYVLTTQ